MEMKIVLTRLNVAFRAGRSEVEITLKRLNSLLNCHSERNEQSLNPPSQQNLRCFASLNMTQISMSRFNGSTL